MIQLLLIEFYKALQNFPHDCIVILHNEMWWHCQIVSCICIRTGICVCICILICIAALHKGVLTVEAVPNHFLPPWWARRLLKRRGVPMHQTARNEIHKYTNTQIHKYTNSKTHKYTVGAPTPVREVWRPNATHYQYERNTCDNI